MNPILARELRVRFRDKRSFWLLFILTALLCLMAGWIYWDAVSTFETPDYYQSGRYLSEPLTNQSVLRQASETGRKLFLFLAMGNSLAWLLIAPALTATGLAKERERGLLESLWLSAFRVRGQVLGRLSATLCYLLVLQVAVLPVYGIALLLGGVSPAEIGVAGLVIALTALLGASLGLWCSARAYRSTNALGTVFVLVGIWSFVVFQAMNSMWSWSGFDPTTFSIVFSHPVTLLYFLLAPQNFLRSGALPFSRSDALLFGFLFQVTLSLALLWSTTRLAARPLPDRRWSEGNTRIQAWRASLETAKKQRQERREREKASQKMAGALLYELPVEKFVRFKDPILSREVRGHFRLRQSGLGTSILRFGIFALGVAFWLMVVFNAFDRASHAATGPILLNGLLGFGIFAIAVMASTSLVREREMGTWEGLRLSLLPPKVLIKSKWLSPLITFVYWSAPLWILLPLCLRWNGRDGASLPWLIAAVFVLLASLASVSAWALWVSRRAPHSAAATSWTLATLLLMLAGIPILDSMVNLNWKMASLISSGNYGGGDFHGYYSDFYRDPNFEGMQNIKAMLDAYHPFLTLNMLLGEPEANYIRYTSATKLLVCLLYLIYNGSLTAFLLWLVTRRLKKVEE